MAGAPSVCWPGSGTRQAHPEWAVRAGERCGEAPFLLPTNGFIGYLWGDSFRPGHSHQGIDIFGGKGLGRPRWWRLIPAI